MASVTGVREIVFALREHGEDMERETESELHRVAGMVATRMRELAPKGPNNTLTNSIMPKQIDAKTWDIGPNVDHAWYVNYGVKAGGKGLPRFMGPDSKSIVDWLQSKAFSGKGRARKGTGRFTARELELRDRYEGLAWHVRHKGVKAQPFVEPTAKEMEPVLLSRLDLAVRRVLASRPDAGSATA